MYEVLIAHLRECAKLDPSNNTYAEAAYAIEELIGFVQEAERDRDEYRERLDKANDAIDELVRKEKFHAFLWNTIQPNEMEAYISMYNAGNEKEGI